MMRNALRVGTLLFIALLASWSFAQEAPEEAVKALAQKWIDGWDSGDMAAIAALYTEDGDLLGADGQMVKGRAAIESYLAQLKSGPLADATLTVGEPDVRCVTETICISDSSYEFSGGENPSSGLTTLVIVKQGGEWLIAAHRSRVPVPAPQ